MKTLVYSSHQFEQPFMLKAAEGLIELFFTTESLSKETAYLAQNYESISLFTSDNAHSEVLDILSKGGVKFIVLRSVGYDHVDIDAASKLGIKVSNVPSYSPHAIAEFAVALILTLNRKLLQSQELIKHNNFCIDSLVGYDLYGKTVGIIGTGKIGSAFAIIMKGFGCRILAYDVHKNEDLLEKIEVEYVAKEEVCTQSDIISVHCPLNEVSQYMFDYAMFSLMKKGVIFINTARGSIVKSIDLIRILKEEKIGGVGLDVYESEKPIFFQDLSDKPLSDPIFKELQSFKNVLITGHQAFLTHEALTGIANTSIGSLVEFSQNGKSRYQLN